MKSLAKASIILPTFNEVGNIVELIERLNVEVEAPKEIIIVDDNSPDGTSAAVATYIKTKKLTNVLLETRTTNRGLTNSLNHGLSVSTGSIVCWMDADFSHPPQTMATLIREVRNGKDCAIATRFVRVFRPKNIRASRDSRLRIFLSYLLNLTLKCIIKYPFSDYTSGFIAIRKDVLFSTIPKLDGDYGEYFINMTYALLKRGINLTEVAFDSPPRKAGQSKTAPNFFMLCYRGVKYLQAAFSL